MSTLIPASTVCNPTIPSTGIGLEGWREFWRTESARTGSDWIGVAELRLAIIHRLQRESSLWISS
jgi:hypothetical protein